MRSIIAGVLLVTLLYSCGSAKQAQNNSVTKHPDVVRTTDVSITGENVIQEIIKMDGFEMAQSLSEDGTKIIEVAYRWFAGNGEADNKQVAIELAQREAYATISRLFNNAVMDQAKRGNVVKTGKVQQALTSYWEQISATILKGAEPYGDVIVEYSPSTRMYNATAKVALRGDRFNQLMNSAAAYRPNDLNGTELQEFISGNKAILEAARGN